MALEITIDLGIPDIPVVKPRYGYYTTRPQI